MSNPANFGDDRLPDRFWSKVRRLPEGCWEWQANTLPNGYGQFWWVDRKKLAHRVAYEQLTGPIPSGLEIDHLCRNRACVNPDHLEAVTRQVNILRGNHRSAIAWRSGLCAKGLHPMTYRKNGKSECFRCRDERMKTWRQRRKGAKR